MVSIVLACSLVIFLALHQPIGIALGLSSMCAILVGDSLTIEYLVRTLVTATDSFPLLAIPFFMLAGELMAKGGISRRLINVASAFCGRYTGGLATVSIVTCMFFAAISGSGPATVAAVGGIMIPAMMDKGYEKNFSSAIVAAAGSIGVVIPPSIPMVVYCSTVGTVSVSAMFLAGVGPGLLIGLTLVLVSYITSRKRGFHGEERRYTAREKLHVLNEGKWSLLVPVIILGGIYGGIFTATEAAGVAVFYGLIVGLFVYKELNLSNLIEAFRDAALTTGKVLIIMGAATTFGRILTMEQIPTRIAAYITSLTTNKILILLAINILLLFIGCFMEALSSIILLTPILLPIVTAVGVDPLHFGIIFVVNMSISFITPPLGVDLFVAATTADTTLEQISKAVIIPLIAMIAVLMVITYWEPLCLWLPQMVTGYVRA